MNRADRRKRQKAQRREKNAMKLVPSSANTATSSGGYWKQVYVPPPEMNIANGPTKERS
jgi:hypothetical protein